MTSKEYRGILSKLVQNTIRKHFPGLKKDVLAQAGREAAVNIHARMYGANVDNVDSPIWRENFEGWPLVEKNSQPNVDASELLKEEIKI